MTGLALGLVPALFAVLAVFSFLRRQWWRAVACLSGGLGAAMGGLAVFGHHPWARPVGTVLLLGAVAAGVADRRRA